MHANTKKIYRLGARASTLSQWQARHVAAAFEAMHKDTKVELAVYSTTGDKDQKTPLPEIGVKGLFTAELEKALFEGEIDFAVHSQKDLPTEDPKGLSCVAILERENPADVLISRGGFTLETLPQGATIGTSSTRRAAQALFLRPDIKAIDIRGNVETRISKALDPNGPFDGIMLAYAGVARLGRLSQVSQIISHDTFLPAPGQGALAVQCLTDSLATPLLKQMNHLPTQVATTAERAFLGGLGGGCSLPIAAYAKWQDDVLYLEGRVIAKDGKERIQVKARERFDLNRESCVEDAKKLGITLAQLAISEGADRLLKVPANAPII